MKKIIVSNRIKLVLDPTEPDTPCMVHFKVHLNSSSASYRCSMGEGYVDGNELTKDEYDRLYALRHAVEDCESEVAKAKSVL